MDVKSENDFEQFYENTYKHAIDSYYEESKEKRNGIMIGGGVLFAIMISACLSLANALGLKSFLIQNGIQYELVILTFVVISLLVFLISIYKLLKKTMANISESIIRDIFAFIGDQNPKTPVDYRPNVKLSAESINKMELFNLDVLKYTGKNYAAVQYNKRIMCFCDINVYALEKTNSTRIVYKNGKKCIRRYTKRNNIFDGLYIGAPLNKNNTNHIYLIPNNLSDTVLQSKIMSYIKYQGVPVMLENLEFSKKYKVFCDDEVQARYILSLSLMEKINKLDELFKEKKYIVFKEGKRFAICIEGIKLQSIRDIKLPVFRNIKKERITLMDTFAKLNNLFKIYHVLDLGNDLYVKYV